MKTFMKQKIKLFKKTGEKIDDIMASIQDRRIFTDQKISIEIGDFFIYRNPLGIDEKLVIDDVYMPTDRGGNFHHIEIAYHKDIK